jgi:hypothetical protein
MTKIVMGDSLEKEEPTEGKEAELEETELEDEKSEDEEKSDEAEEGTPAISDATDDPDEEPEKEEIVDTPKEVVEKKLQPIEDLEKTKKELEDEVANLANDPSRTNLLDDIKELRTVRRVLKGQPFKKDSPVFVKKEEDVDLLKDVAPDDVSTIEKVLRAKGYVPRAELEREQSVRTYKQQMDDSTNEWLKENPEFDVDHDTDNTKWQKLHDYLADNFDAPKNPKASKDLLDIARDRLFGKKSPQLPEKSPHSIAAKKEKIAVSSAKPSSGGTNVSGSPSKLGSSARQHLIGFSEEELVEMGL